jgi:hypothetical protein
LESKTSHFVGSSQPNKGRQYLIPTGTYSRHSDTQRKTLASKTEGAVRIRRHHRQALFGSTMLRVGTLLEVH